MKLDSIRSNGWLAKALADDSRGRAFLLIYLPILTNYRQYYEHACTFVRGLVCSQTKRRQLRRGITKLMKSGNVLAPSNCISL
jgi:hypothetical protein